MTSVSHDDLMEIPVLKWPEIHRAMFWYTGGCEDEEADSLLVLFAENRPATSQDVKGELWIRYDSCTGDIIGIEIDDFEQLFLSEFHPELADGWKVLKPAAKGGRHQSEWLAGADATAYARALRDVAQQGGLSSGIRFTSGSAN